MGAFENAMWEEGTWEEMYIQLTKLAIKKGYTRRQFMNKLLKFYDEVLNES